MLWLLLMIGGIVNANVISTHVLELSEDVTSLHKKDCQYEVDGVCLQPGEIHLLSLPQRRHQTDAHNHMRIIAVLDNNLTAKSEIKHGIQVKVSNNKIMLHVANDNESEKYVNSVRMYGFGENQPRPRVLRLNGELLRHGDLHYHRNLRMLELFDLNLPLTSDNVLEILSSDQEAEEIECPVSYKNRNPDFSIPESACMAPCVWNTGCWLPPTTDYGYVINGAAENTQFGFRVPLTKIGDSLYNAAIQNIAVEVFIYSESLVRIKIYDPAVARYEVPIALNLPTTPYTGETQYDIVILDVLGAEFYVQVVRRDTGTIIFDTSLVGLTFEDQLLSVALRLPSRNLYGLGESYHPTFRRELDDSTWPIWAKDELPDVGEQFNLYGVHPFYEVIENDGNANGVLIYNSNAMEYQLQSVAPAVVYRTIGGILDFYVVTGPSPEDVIRQYTEVVGRSFLPPYWSLGFQQSRWGYNTLDNMRDSIQRTKDCGIPLDVFYGDIDVMDKEADFTIDPVNFSELPTFVDEQRALGLRYVPIVDPAIPNRTTNYPTFERGLQADAYVRWSAEQGGEVMMGNVWPPEPTAFSDYFRSSTYDWWENEIRLFYNLIKFDGLWIDMNEPSNFLTNVGSNNESLVCPENPLDDPPYLPKAGVTGLTNRISDKTICMSTVQGDGGKYRHYDVHSLYGYSETIPTSRALQAVTGKRGLVFTRSSFVGSGILGGHWTGDNTARWDHMQYSIIGLLDFNLFGLPYVGADICGFQGGSSEELCQRWQELGAFYPFSRNHNAFGFSAQDPCIWPDTVGASTRKAMLVRYRLLPYFYTAFYRANQGVDGTVIRSLLHQFPGDRETLGIDRQFMWSDALLISPVLEAGVTSISAYFPAGRWYDYYQSTPLDSLGEYVNLDVPLDHIPVHIRAGKIIPVQQPDITTTASRQNAHGLIVATDGSSSAQGDLFWDDGESIDTVQPGNYHYSNFDFQNFVLTQSIVNTFPAEMQGRFIEDVEFLGLTSEPMAVSGDVGPDVVLTYDAQNQKLTLSSAHIPLDIDFRVQFNL